MIQKTLFGDRMRATPRTQGIKYAGSKLKLLPRILNLIGRTDAKVILDGFSGSTRVSQALAQSGYTVTSNDIAVWSETLARC
jgi:adenine-specific DNA-methyltransferase